MAVAKSASHALQRAREWKYGMEKNRKGRKIMLNIAGIIDDSIVDGEGLRLTIFCQGCPHHCTGCHNPETWSYDINKQKSVADIINLVQKNTLLDGVTFSGGDPMEQAKELLPLAKKIKQMGLTVWCYTGYTYEDIIAAKDDKTKLLKYIDVLVDGPYVEALRNTAALYRGSDNQRLIDVTATRAQKSIVLWEEN